MLPVHRDPDGPFARQALDRLDVFLVGVPCELAGIDRRERARGNRSIGEDRSRVGVTRALTERVQAAWQARGPYPTTAFVPVAPLLPARSAMFSMRAHHGRS